MRSLTMPLANFNLRQSPDGIAPTAGSRIPGPIGASDGNHRQGAGGVVKPQDAGSGASRVTGRPFKLGTRTYRLRQADSTSDPGWVEEPIATEEARAIIAEAARQFRGDVSLDDLTATAFQLATRGPDVLDQIVLVRLRPAGSVGPTLRAPRPQPTPARAPKPLPPPPVANAPRKPRYDLQNVKAPRHIASGKETIQIEYDIVNIEDCISTGKVRILRASDSKELTSMALSADQYTHGHHAFPWDGGVSADAEFPDGFATIEHSAYTVEVSIGDRFGPRKGTATVKVELKRFTVEKGARTLLTNDKDQKIWDQVKAIPTGGLQKLMLDSNLFAVQSSDMNDGTAFAEYSNLWGDGPRIPLIATATVFDSKEQEVRAGKALGRAKVLWDYLDPRQVQPAYTGIGAQAFVDAAAAYDAAATRPADGDNCHVDRGGKRDSATGVEVLTAPDGDITGFPFVVNAGATRWWGGFGDFQKSGDDEARAGVVFRPSRMAGDNYALKAYLDIRQKLDTADKTPAGADATADIGTFEVWRRITVPEHFKKCAEVTGAMAEFASYYADAFMVVDDQRGTPKAMSKADYDAAFAAALPGAQSTMNGYGGGYALVSKYGLPGADVSQYDCARLPGSLGGKIIDFLGKVVRAVGSLFGLSSAPAPTTWVATFLPYGDFTDAVQSGQGLTSAQTEALLKKNRLADEKAYAAKTKDFAKTIATDMCKALATKDGVTVLQFEWTSSHEELLGSRLNGNACFKLLNSCGFALYNASVAQTPAHEIGHNLFLPHAPRNITKNGATVVLDETTAAGLGESSGGILKDRHDINNRQCLMSYARPRPGFCGLCVVRLRGWDESQFDENGATVSKP
jgi:hypothetical protein